MIIRKINPQGYCNGVKRALNIVSNALEDKNVKRPIYLLGQIIHNKHVVKDFIDKGAIVVEDKTKSRLELLDSINEGTVIFSAHGVSPLVYKKAKEKGLNIIDATCGYVLIVHKKIEDYLNKGFDVIYIGTKNHPEVEGVLGISNKIHFISNLEQIKNLNITNDKIYCTNQTTLSQYDIIDIFNLLKKKYPNILIDDKICDATTVRQKAMKEQEKADLCIVVGDSASSNTKKLYKVSSELAGIKTILCEDLKSLDKNELKNVKTVNISSGASTPDYIVDEIINYLISID
ncbi:MAG: 4-hydroxy-3-methylbut-2-enyl diphosphate reductase [Acholeplasmatales bacterium]|nr:4-hydroxy-3-methylbut-2-enyl diphosphate reductase [Acholeplasmatales bacterium]